MPAAADDEDTQRYQAEQQPVAHAGRGGGAYKHRQVITSESRYTHAAWECLEKQQQKRQQKQHNPRAMRLHIILRS